MLRHRERDQSFVRVGFDGGFDEGALLEGGGVACAANYQEAGCVFAGVLDVGGED